MSYLRNVNATIADSANLDAFSRIRVSNPYGLFEAKYVHDNLPVSMPEVTSGTGASVSYLYQESACSLSSGTDTNSFALKQSRIYIPYTPGKGMLVIMTGVLGSASSACARRIGLFDNYNGVFFELTDTLKIVERSNISGSIVDTKVSQLSWNLDTMDGNGPSGVNLDTTKAQIFLIDYQWLGVGRIRYGLDIDGKIIYVHETMHANIVTAVYMKTPTLPVRWEIRKLSGSSNFTMKAICCSVTSEAGYNPIAVRFSAGRKAVLKAMNGTRLPIFAIRLKTAFGNSSSVPYVNRKIAKLYNAVFYATNDPIYFEIDHVTDISAITATFNSVSATSACEYSTDISAVTASYESTIHSQYLSASSNGNNANAGAGEMVSEPSVSTIGNIISQNYDSTSSQLWIVYGTSLTGTPSAGCALEWLEYD